MWWATWWAWGLAAVIFAIAEVILPSYIFLGFAAGAAATGALFLIGGPFVAWIGSGPEVTFLAFVVLSLVAWIALRRLLGVRAGQVKIFDRDINED